MTVTADERSLLRAIASDPDADHPRLAYAAWAEGRGDFDRGRFIRCQVEAARLPEGDDRRHALELEAQALLATTPKDRQSHRDRWEVPLHSLGVTHVEWERGFPARVTAAADAFVRHGAALIDRGVYHLVVANPRGRPASLDEVVRTPAFQEIWGLDAWDAWHSMDALRTLATSSTLRHLDLSFGRLGPEDLTALAGCQRLTSLVLADNPLGRGGAEALASGTWPGLRHLDLAGCGLGSRGLQALADGTAFPALTSLRAAGNGIGPHGVRAFARSSLATHLAALDLADNPLGTEGLDAMLASGCLSHLGQLILRGAGIGPRGLAALATALPDDCRLTLDGLEGDTQALRRSLPPADPHMVVRPRSPGGGPSRR